MKRWAVVVGLVAVVGLGTAGCGLVAGGAAGPASADQTAYDVTAAMGAEGQALTAMGYDPDDVTPVELAEAASPEPSASATPAPQRERLRKRLTARVLLRRNTLHGEAVVQTKDGGTKTVLVQRGEVTAVDGDSITVKSTDGFSQTWVYADDLHVVEHRASIEPQDLQVGAKVGVAGSENGDQPTARLIVIPRAK